MTPPHHVQILWNDPYILLKSKCVVCSHCILCDYVYLIVVDEVHQDLHDTGEDHQAGAGDEEDVDVVK